MKMFKKLLPCRKPQRMDTEKNISPKLHILSPLIMHYIKCLKVAE